MVMIGRITKRKTAKTGKTPFSRAWETAWEIPVGSGGGYHLWWDCVVVKTINTTTIIVDDGDD